MQRNEPDEPTPAGETTRLLSSLASGDRSAQEQLLELVHAELQGMARSALAGERAGHTLQATALVHEAWMKLVGQDQVHWQGRGHFLGVASMAMRRVLVDHARSKQRLKRGGHMRREELNTSIVDPGSEGGSELDVLALHEGLNALAELSPRAARVVELRFFGGVTEPEAAEILGISRPTVTRDWQAAHAWLTNWLDGGTSR